MEVMTVTVHEILKLSQRLRSLDCTNQQFLNFTKIDVEWSIHVCMYVEQINICFSSTSFSCVKLWTTFPSTSHGMSSTLLACPFVHTLQMLKLSHEKKIRYCNVD